MAALIQEPRKSKKSIKPSSKKKSVGVKSTDKKLQSPTKRTSMTTDSSIKFGALSKSARERGMNSFKLTFMGAVTEFGYNKAKSMFLTDDLEFVESVKDMTSEQFAAEKKRLQKLVTAY